MTPFVFLTFVLVLAVGFIARDFNGDPYTRQRMKGIAKLRLIERAYYIFGEQFDYRNFKERDREGRYIIKVDYNKVITYQLLKKYDLIDKGKDLDSFNTLRDTVYNMIKTDGKETTDWYLSIYAI